MELITTDDFLTSVETQLKRLNIFRPDENSTTAGSDLPARTT